MSTERTCTKCTHKKVCIFIDAMFDAIAIQVRASEREGHPIGPKERGRAIELYCESAAAICVHFACDVKGVK